SFSAPQVAAAAGLLFSTQPLLRADQVANLLTRSAADGTKDTGCVACSLGHDPLTGWGRLDIQQALMQAAYSKSEIPAADRYETNDDAGAQAWRVYGQASRTISATLDFWDDQIDVYSVRLRRGQKVEATLRGQAMPRAKLMLWKPGT